MANVCGEIVRQAMRTPAVGLCMWKLVWKWEVTAPIWRGRAPTCKMPIQSASEEEEEGHGNWRSMFSRSSGSSSERWSGPYIVIDCCFGGYIHKCCFLAVSFSDDGDSLCMGDALAGPWNDCGARHGGRCGISIGAEHRFVKKYMKCINIICC